MSPEPVVFKIGGSLLELPDLGSRIHSLLALRPGRRPLFVCGGGRLADVVRDWHERHRLSEFESHRIAMQTLSASALFLAGRLPRGRVCTSRSDLHDAWGNGDVPVVDPAGWMREHPHWFDAANPNRLEESWNVTSDTLAAAIALDTGAQELVLAKSVDLPVRSDVPSLSRLGLVDAAFASHAHPIPNMGWMNLRSGPMVIEPIATR
jgi:aspartokinase-like uncharacterized kinase